MNQGEKIKYIRIIETQWQALEENERRMIEHANENVAQKRAFLGNTMAISAAAIAGLFVLMSQDGIAILASISIPVFVFFILASSAYLVTILSQESLSIDERLRFIRNSKQDFLQKIENKTINDIDSYKKYREQKYKEAKESERKVRGSSEVWFILVNVLFIIPFILLLALFLSVGI